MGKKTNETKLGRSLIKQQSKKRKKKLGTNSLLHTADLQDGSDWNRINFASITEETDIDSFLSTAELAGTDFKAEKLNIKFVRPAAEGILTVSEQTKIRELQQENKALLRIPRRPAWDRTMDPEELAQLERESFLEWRRSLSELQEKDGIILTPYEKNLQFWRQLWRVIERSDVVVQIVDARNPLLFRCEDLQHYVKEVDERKEYLILVNKSDFLTETQRECWSEYFKGEGINAVFFSALDESLDVIEEENSENEDHHVDELFGDYFADDQQLDIIPENDEDIDNSDHDSGNFDHDGDNSEGDSDNSDDSNHSLTENTPNCSISEKKNLKLSTDVEDFVNAVHDCENRLEGMCLRLNDVLNDRPPQEQSEEVSTDLYEGDTIAVNTTDTNKDTRNVDTSETQLIIDDSTNFISNPVALSDTDATGGLEDSISDIGLPKDAHSVSSEVQSPNFRSYINTSIILNKDQLIDFFQTYPSTQITSTHKPRTTIGLVGYPNVGKSSTINSLLSAKKVSVSATPGKTKHFQTHFLGDDLTLCDCPGLVFPAFVSTKAEMIISGILPVDQMRDHVPPTNVVLQQIPRLFLENFYGVHIPKPLDGEDPDRCPSSEEFLSVYGFCRGYMSARGTADQPKSARYILKDYVNGKLLYCHSPPGGIQDEYHTFNVGEIQRVFVEPTPQMKRTLYRPSDNLDEKFFEKPATSHSKGVKVQMVNSGLSSTSSETGSSISLDKPWRQTIREKRNKKQKLRRQFAHLDL